MDTREHVDANGLFCPYCISTHGQRDDHRLTQTGPCSARPLPWASRWTLHSGNPRCGSRICNPDIQEETTPSGRTFDQRGGRRFPHLAPRWTVLRCALHDTSACPMTLSKYHPSPGSGGQLMTRAHTGSLPSPSRSVSRHLPGGSHSPSGTCTTPWSQARLPGEPRLRRWPPQHPPWTAPPISALALPSPLHRPCF